MGAAIEVFEGARTIEVGRDRFVPVKTTNDLLVLRSDCYELDDDARAPPGARRRVPFVDLDKPYKLVGGFEERFPAGVAEPARGDVASSSAATGRSAPDVTVVGEVEVARTARPATVPSPAPAWREPRGVRVAPWPFVPDLDRAVGHRRGARRSGSSTSVEPLPPYDQPLLEALGLPVCERIVVPDGPAGVRQLRDGRLRRGRSPTWQARPRTTRCTLPVVGEVRGRTDEALRDVARARR